jgi:hypothetical protein
MAYSRIAVVLPARACTVLLSAYKRRWFDRWLICEERNPFSFFPISGGQDLEGSFLEAISKTSISFTLRFFERVKKSFPSRPASFA